MKTGKQVVAFFDPKLVRAHFILRGDSYTAWAQRHGFGQYNVCKIINGRQLGAKRNGQRIVKALLRELGRDQA
jgi:gp16 family phage-associated protein